MLLSNSSNSVSIKMLNDIIMHRYLLPRTNLAISIHLYTTQINSFGVSVFLLAAILYSCRVVASSASISSCSQDKSKSNKSYTIESHSILNCLSVVECKSNATAATYSMQYSRHKTMEIYGQFLETSSYRPQQYTRDTL